jgi:5-(carboxyamino)imidazole ribonucleotide mutase
VSHIATRTACNVTEATQALVGIIMGSKSDWETLLPARETLEELHVPCEMRVVSAHRMPDEMFAYAESAAARGLQAIIAGAGGAAHLPGMVAAKTLLPVIGVPVQSKALKGVDSLLSIAQMPPGVPVATMAINGAVNAALIAARMLALHDAGLRARLEAYVQRMHDAAANSTP